MDSAAADTFVQDLKHQRLIVDYVYVASFAVLLYDFLLCFQPEVQLVWFSKWNYTKMLYLFARYAPIVNFYLLLHNKLLPGSSPNTCKWMFSVINALVTLGAVASEAILSFRTWAVWNRNRRVGLALVAVQLTHAIVSTVCAVRFVDSVEVSESPYAGFRGCLPQIKAHSDPMALPWISFVTLLIAQTVVFILMATSAFFAYKSGYISELSNIVHRDALQFYVYLMCIAIWNVTASFMLPPDLATVLFTVQSSMHSIFATRIVINIRAASHHSTLHIWEGGGMRTGNSESGIPLEFFVEDDRDVDDL